MDHNFTLVNCDTDSISICKDDSSFFSNEERTVLLKELNDMFSDNIRWEDDGYYETVIVVKSKNYVLYDGKKLKIKGSSLRDPKKEKALQEFILKIINRFIAGEQQTIINDYKLYVKEIFSLKDINRWSYKKTITDKVLNPERTNEQKVFDAIQGSEYRMADKAYFYFDNDENLKLVENYSNDHNKNRLLKKLYDTLKIFSTLLDVKEFPNYTLKKNSKLLEEVLQ